jgi:glutamyl-tRNA synthetase
MVKTQNKIKTRFAPSPTGEVHIGSARTALFAYLFAKKNEGEFLVRIEDTDQSRIVKDSELRMLELVKWLGMKWSGEPIYQSARLSLYKEYARKLIENGNAYYCFCSSERLEALRNEQSAKGEITRYDRKCRDLPIEEVLEKIKNNEPHVIRLKIPETGKIKFQDLIHGEVEFDLSNVEDQVLIKSDGFPTYHLAVVVDDHDQGVTHVLRGDEWLSSTPKHLFLYKCFDWEPTVYAHLPVIIGKDKKKLSKREGSVSVEDFKQRGYLPEALVNFIALLGWNPGTEQEFFPLKELEKEFDATKINKAPAFFDIEKLNHFNAHYIHQMSEEELLKRVRPYSKIDFENNVNEYLQKVAKVTRERMVLLTDFDVHSRIFFTYKEPDKDMVRFAKSDWQNTTLGLKKAIEKLEKAIAHDWDFVGKITDILSEVVSENGLKNGDVFWPVRAALSGEMASPSPSELLWVLGREESLKRLNKVLNIIK